jgi:hypothetical protein
MTRLHAALGDDFVDQVGDLRDPVTADVRAL